ncbi:MAG: hypothetical protein RQ745_08105 [Longimicrobiales bacterium]|nr:hypothetical protein [Longimicrobiales bacterium]
MIALHRSVALPLVALALAGGAHPPLAAPLAAQQVASLQPGPNADLFGGIGYRLVGPTRGGRATAVAGHRAHPGTFYMGATGGGVWKTDDWGVTWRPVSDGYFATGSIGAITVAPSDADVVWVGTGSDGLRSNVIVGRGVYRSTDAGATWTHAGLEKAGQIGAVIVHPTDPDVAWVAALGDPFGTNEERGVYHTTDGGATWDHQLFVSDSVGVIDMEMHPTNPEILYAGAWRGERKPWTIISGMEEDAREDGIWRSLDGGETWEYRQIGLESNLIGKIDFAVSPADPDRVYALVETKEPEEGLYRSDDRGETWRLVSGDFQPIMDRPFYYTNVDADPTDADKVWVSATQFWYSEDGGASFERRATPHGDNHDLWINPDDPRIMVQSNDGGTNVTRDGGRTWSTQMNQPTAELYSADIDDRFPYWIYSGQQDNTTLRVPSGPTPGVSPGEIEPVGGCETGPVVPKPGSDGRVVYANCKGRFGTWSGRTGQERQYYVGAANMYGTNPAELTYRFQRVVPVEVSPHNPDVVYHGSQYVHRTTDDGETWERISPDLTAFRPERQMVSGGPITRDATGEEHYSTLYAIEESPLQPGVIWAGANDGPIHLTRDGGETWEDVTPSDLPPEGRVQTIDPSPHHAGTAYVAVYRYLLGDYRPYLYRTEDYGETWTRLTDGANGIPADFPTRVIREDPEHEGLLYAGTEFGLFVSLDDGASWEPLQLNLPVTPINDMKVVDGDLVVATMGRSFWVLDDLTPVRAAARGLDRSAARLLVPREAVRMRSGGDAFDFGTQIEPSFAPPGAYLDYLIPPSGLADPSIEIVMPDGRIAQRFEGADTRATEPAQEMRGPFQRRRGRQGVSSEPGAHRLVWDFSVDAGAGRPLTAWPGTYTARLRSGDRVVDEVNFEVVIDPRVAADGVTTDDLIAQFELQEEVAATLREAQAANRRVQAGRERASGATKEAFDALHYRLNEVEVGSYPKPMLLGQLGYLSGMIGRADQRPGRDAYERHEELQAELQAILTELARLERLIAEGDAAQTAGSSVTR